MAGNKLFEQNLQLITPHTYNAVTKLVVAMAKVVKNIGKKTFFGKDKEQEAYLNFYNILKLTINAMVLDGIIKESGTDENVYQALDEYLKKFSMAHPNWPDAYGFASMYFGDNKQDSLAVIHRLR